MNHHLPLLLLLLILFHVPPCPAAGGSWYMLLPSIGISAMHMQLLPNDRVVIFDRTDFGTSNISLPDGKCRPNSNDCSAHSVEYDVATNTVRPLMVLSNVWCSSGSLMPDGTLTQTGGNDFGGLVVRNYNSCDTCDWEDIPNGLVAPRWYATNHKLPDGRQIIIGGRDTFSYEFFPKTPGSDTVVEFPFLVETNDPGLENNLYPFVFLYPDGNLFIFANNRAILFDYVNNQVVRTFPIIPGDEPRNYPSTGSAVLLPMRIVNGIVNDVEVLVCGGAPRTAFPNASINIFERALDTCGRIKISDPDPQWVMETMPLARVMGDMLLLPNGDVLMINGAAAGAAGWEFGRDPVLSPVTYKPGNPVESRFEVQTPATIPRMYHSASILLRDGRVLVGGSNPHDKYLFTDTLYPTELSLEEFSPSYLDSALSGLRPVIITPACGVNIGYGNEMVINFAVSDNLDPNSVIVTLVLPSFNTHSFSMNQRLLILDSDMIATTDLDSSKCQLPATMPPSGNIGPAEDLLESSNYLVRVTMPPNGNIAPTGYYLLFVVHKDIPSEGIWMHIQ